MAKVGVPAQPRPAELADTAQKGGGEEDCTNKDWVSQLNGNDEL
jgi:hypothetical protein